MHPAVSAFRAKGWSVKAPATSIPPQWSGLDADYLEFASGFRSLTNATEQVWFLTAEDFAADAADNDWAWNSFEAMSVEAAGSSAEKAAIAQFWASVTPILFDVSGDYAFVALSQAGVIAGCAPEFEEADVIAASFAQFLEIATGARRPATPHPIWSAF